MFEKIFDEYRRAIESSIKIQQDMYRQWMSGLPVKPPEVTQTDDPGAIKDQIYRYQREWTHTLAETLDKHRQALDQQYKSGIDAIASAFRMTEARTPEQYWRLTQEFWRKSIDTFKMTIEAQSKYVEGLAEMWLEMVTRGKA